MFKTKTNTFLSSRRLETKTLVSRTTSLDKIPKHTHIHHDKGMITISEPPYYVVGADIGEATGYLVACQPPLAGARRAVYVNQNNVTTPCLFLFRY